MRLSSLRRLPNRWTRPPGRHLLGSSWLLGCLATQVRGCSHWRLRPRLAWQVVLVRICRLLSPCLLEPCRVWRLACQHHWTLSCKCRLRRPCMQRHQVWHLWEPTKDIQVCWGSWASMTPSCRQPKNSTL